MRHPAEDAIDELVGEFFYIIAPDVLPGCPPPGAGYSLLSDVGSEASPPAAGNGVEIGRYPLGMQSGVR